MNILKTTILALATAGTLGVAALSSATPAAAHYYGYRHHYYTYNYYRPYCFIKWDYYGNAYKVCR